MPNGADAKSSALASGRCGAWSVASTVIAEKNTSAPGQPGRNARPTITPSGPNRAHGRTCVSSGERAEVRSIVVKNVVAIAAIAKNSQRTSSPGPETTSEATPNHANSASVAPRSRSAKLSASGAMRDPAKASAM